MADVRFGKAAPDLQWKSLGWNTRKEMGRVKFGDNGLWQRQSLSRSFQRTFVASSALDALGFDRSPERPGVKFSLAFGTSMDPPAPKQR